MELPPALVRLRRRLSHAADIEGMMLFLGGLTGFLTGILAATLILLIRAVQRFAWGAHVGWWEILLVPTIGGLLVGIWVTYVAPESSGSGVTRVMESLALRGGRFRGRVPLTGLAATSLALGTGASGGRETPIALMGGATGSFLGRAFTLDDERMQALIGAGVAAGIGASFNAPIGGMLFAIEIIMGGLRARSLQVVVVSSVVGSVTARQIIGSDITFQPERTYALGDPRDLLLFALLGVAAAGLGIVIMRGEELAMSFFTETRRRLRWRPLSLAFGGLLVGVTALIVPEVLGTGDNLPAISGMRDPIQAMLDGSYGIGWKPGLTLLALLAVKLIATLASVGSGNAVGTFAPTLFLGAALGGAFGAFAGQIAPGAIQPGAVALVGMASAFAAADKAPLTAILISFELTSDYGLILPLMLSCGLATYLSSLIEPDSVYVHPLRKRGISFGTPEDIDVMQSVTVAEVMTVGHPTLLDTQTYGETLELFETTGSHGFAVVDREGRLAGVITRTDLERALTRDDVLLERRDPESLLAGELCTPQPVTVHPDQAVYTAVHRMAALDVGRIPVIETGTNRLLGLVRRADVLRAYQRGLNRHLGDQQRKASGQLRDLSGVQFLELIVDPEALASGTKVRDIPWPARTILTSIRRNGTLLLPTGDTDLQAGDDLVVLADRAAVDKVRAIVATPVRDVLDPTAPTD